jgi:hypothetical protein
MVVSLALHHAPLCPFSEWALTLGEGPMGLAPSELELLNDDRIGRVLEAMFDAHRTTC